MEEYYRLTMTYVSEEDSERVDSVIFDHYPSGFEVLGWASLRIPHLDSVYLKKLQIDKFTPNITGLGKNLVN